MWIVYLDAVVGLRRDGGVEHDVLHVRERADDVEQQLGPVPAPDVHHRVGLLLAVLHRHHRPAAALAAGRRCAVSVAVHVHVGVHELVQPPVHVVRRRPDREVGERAAAAVVAAAVPVPAEHVPQPGLDPGHAAGVVDGLARGHVVHVHHAGDAHPVGPHLGRQHVALEVGEHGEDLREEARPVGALELDGGVVADGVQPDRSPRRVAAFCAEQIALWT
jgi:hypothetical protein